MRALARELAFQLIFERLFVKDNFSDEEFFVSLKKEEDINFAKEILTSLKIIDSKLKIQYHHIL